MFRLVLRVAALLLIVGAAVYGLARATGLLRDDPPSTATPRDEAYWRELHRGFLDHPDRSKIDLLFLGDSITDGWNDNATWERYYQPRRAARFGIGGDRTQHLLWRVENGELEGMRPRVIVVLIGTNNIGPDTPEQIAAGIRKVVEAIHGRAAESEILLLGVLPRGLYADRAARQAKLDPRTAEINGRLREYAAGAGERVHFLDISESFLTESGPSKALMPDFLHLSLEGYRVWAEAMEVELARLLERSK